MDLRPITESIASESLVDRVKLFESTESMQGEDFNNKRKNDVLLYLGCLGLTFDVHKYETGENIIASVGKPPYIGVGSHFDVVPGSPGANDNASAMAVTIDVLRRFKDSPLENIGVRGFFFDEEENRLRGSRAYVRERGIDDLVGVYNMELVGSGENLAFWAENEVHDGTLLKTIEQCAKNQGVQTYRFPSISRFLMNSGDHESFIEAGFPEAFCITAVSNKDIELARKYGLIGGTKPSLLGLAQLALTGGANILFSSDLFKHYHQPTDISEHLDCKTLQRVSDLLRDSILEIDRNFK
ncbi:MAG: Zn-dependent exopeptidase M28 [Nanoarchaeota archaeon]|nr:Zn-dependent exopeptidase M28 [Nanoarchaeota archaeon]MBU1103937.1 Zn-dependent exopeptidase M28 [Nanoarchaeota archaeon]